MAVVIPAFAKNLFAGGALLASTNGGRGLETILNQLRTGLQKAITTDEIPGKLAVTIEAEAADKRNLRVSIVNPAGVVIPGAKLVKIRALSPTNGQGILAVATSAPKGSLRKTTANAAGENTMTMLSDVDGTFAFSVGDTAAEIVDLEIMVDGFPVVLFAAAFA